MLLENSQKHCIHASFTSQVSFILALRPDVSLIFIFVSYKLTHQYSTLANHQHKMDRLEQENCELKEEVVRLINLMESLIASQSQADPTPTTS